MIQEILGGLILIVAVVMIAIRFKKQVTVGELSLIHISEPTRPY